MVKNKFNLALNIITASLYLLLIVCYITISVLSESFTFDLIPLEIFLLSFSIMGVLFLMQEKIHKAIIVPLAAVLSTTALVVYGFYFGLVSCQNLNAIFIRLGRGDNMQNDLPIAIFLISEAALMVLVTISENIVFITHKRDLNNATTTNS